MARDLSTAIGREGRALAWQVPLAAGALIVAFALRFDFVIPHTYLIVMWQAMLIALPVKALVFSRARLHSVHWHSAGLADVWTLCVANAVASLAFSVVTLVVLRRAVPRSIYVLDYVSCLLAFGGFEFAYRLHTEAIRGTLTRHSAKRILIYGAGQAGIMLLREFRANPRLGRVVGFIDDDPAKQQVTVMGCPVLGAGRQTARIVDGLKPRHSAVDEVVIAMPSATGRQLREAVANCRAAGVPCKTIPGISDLLGGRILSTQIRDVAVADLLGREAIRLDERRISRTIMGGSIMVTGAAGSIGSELCRQIASYSPRRLIIFDQAESDVFRLDLELRRTQPSVEVTVAIGDVRDVMRLDEVIALHRVTAIYHAAAYKHVPLMESHVLQAVQNNVIGTLNVLRAASRHQVKRFLLISSDKAVNPTNIMGVTKRVTELLVAAVAAREPENGMHCVSVRFGNVLGSNGSVVPLFQEQIAKGGPVTVTHPEVRRYFMTVREAVQLVLQASTMGQKAEIFVLDMGEPVRVADLAKNMIRLAGLEPDEDIEIRYVGLRPGEKLYEELITAGENVQPTYHEKIKIFKGEASDSLTIERWLERLQTLVTERDEIALVAHLRALVPEYHVDPANMRTAVFGETVA